MNAPGLPKAGAGPVRPKRGDLGMMRSMTVPGDGPNVARLGREIPIPDVPVEPVLSFGTFLPSRSKPVPSVLDAGHVAGCVTGRTAIAKALECMGLGPGSTVLIPAYHCMSMVEPLSHVGAAPRFFRIRNDLTVDLEDIERKIDGSVRAVMVTHYFGFPQDMRALRELCDRHRLLLLEDCAHCFFGTVQGRPPGGWGDFAIASQRKFFPIFDGGLLIGRRPEMRRLSLRGQTVAQNLKAAFNMIETAVRYGRLGAIAPLIWIIDRMRTRLALDAVQARAATAAQPAGSINPAQSNSGGAGGFDSAWVGRAPTLASRIVLATASKARIARQRRSTYAHIARGLRDIPGCTVLKPDLPADVVPYALPLRIENLARVFPALEDAALPMQRFGQFLWPGVDRRTCAISADLSNNGLQISCHQEMTASEVDSVIARIRDILQSMSPSAAIRRRTGDRQPNAEPAMELQ